MNRLALILAALPLLSGCTGVIVSPPGEPRLIAVPRDTGIIDRKPLSQRQAALAVDPDGCTAWIIDDGAEGYATRRRDPVSGLPVCSKSLRPGDVYGEARANSFPDIVPE